MGATLQCVRITTIGRQDTLNEISPFSTVLPVLLSLSDYLDLSLSQGRLTLALRRMHAHEK